MESLYKYKAEGIKTKDNNTIVIIKILINEDGDSYNIEIYPSFKKLQIND